MSPFPPGMTRLDWQHIEGESHHPRCPAHEDADCPCLEAGDDMCDKCYEDQVSSPHADDCTSDVCRGVCKCQDIDRDRRDDEAEKRADERREGAA